MKFQHRQLLPVTGLGLAGSLISMGTCNEHANPMRRAFRRHALGLACLAAMAPFSARADFSGLGDLPGGGNNSSAFAVSADGLVAVGESDAGNTEAFRWTSAGGMTSLGIVSAYSSAYGVSADGSVIVGYYDNGGHTEAFRWTSGGYAGLGVAGYIHSFAFGVSADGTTVVGHVQGAGQAKAYAWTQGSGMLLLDYLPGGSPASYAYGVSGDGTIAVGFSRLAMGGDRAVRWDTTTGAVTALGFLPASTGQSRARAISSNGLVVVGDAQNSAGNGEAFRWTQAGGMAGLGSIVGHADSYATAVSADGSVVVGGAESPASEVAFYWDQAGGMRTVQDWLSNSGVNIGTWQLNTAYGVSADGQTVVGTGYNPAGDVEAFIARPGVLAGVSDLANSVTSLSKVAHLPTEIGRAGVMDGIPGLSGLMGYSAAPIYLHVSGSRADLGGAALTWRRQGLALAGQVGVLDAAASGLHDGGRADFSGLWLGAGASMDLAELLQRPGLQGLEVDAALRIDRYDADIRRNYLNGAAIETAQGEANADDFTGLVRLGWRLPARRGMEFIPYLEWLYSRVAIAAYDEGGGALAGHVSAMERDALESALGLNVAWQARPDLQLRAGASLRHLHDDRSVTASVAIPGIGTMTSGGRPYDANWHELGLGLDWDLGKRSRLSTSLTMTGGSDYPENWSAGIALHMGI